MPDRMLTARQVADKLNVTPVTVTRNARRIPGAHKVFGRWRFDADQLDAWLQSRQEAPDPWAAPKRGIA